MIEDYDNFFIQP